MKKFFTLSLFLTALLFSFQGNAKKVEVADASAAGHFFITQTQEMSPNDVFLERVYTAIDATNPAQALYYVFNINQQQGYVIVSANDIAVPILGYSLQGSYVHDDAPLNFKSWMSSVAEAIRRGIEQNYQPDEETVTEWRALLEQDVHYFALQRGETAVNPLIATKWDQGDPYNQQCPTYSGNKCLTGCVATAMAQVMKYHAYPASGTGTIPAYTTRTLKLSVPAVPLGETYQWSNMINQYGGGATQQQKDAVALLMYHCGASVEMDYGLAASGAYSADAGVSMTTYFKYDKSMRMQDKAYFTNAEWIDLLKQSLDATLPIYYKGQGPDGGHAFVCDGYNTSNQFHFNWGWSGYNDGYFSVTPMPSYLFPNSNAAFVGLKPDAGGAQAYNIDIYPENNLTSSATGVPPAQTFTVSALIYNSGYKEATGMQGAIGLYQGNTLIATMGTKGISNLPGGYWFTSPISFSCQVPAGTPVGNYTIRLLIKTSNSDWQVARASIGYKAELPLQVTNKTYTIIAQAESGGNIDPKGNITVAENGNQTFTITSNSGYAISKVLVDGVNKPEAVTSGSYTFSNVTDDHVITAKFEQASHVITATAGENGTITPSGEIAVADGGSKIFVIAANENYQVDDVLVDGTSVGAVSGYTFSNVTSNHTIEATFKAKGVNIEETNIAGITVFPNPTDGELTIGHEICDNEICDIKIFDVMGRIVFQLSTLNSQLSTQIDISIFPAGVYFIRITTEEGIITKKIVKR
jgi:hypothetical protein